MRRPILPATPEDLRAAILRQIPEMAFQEQLRDLCLPLGWLYYHTHDSRRSDAGFPDTVMVHPSGGPVIVAELKRVGEQPSKAQHQWLELLDGRTIDCRLWDPRDWAEIERMLRR